MAVRNIITIDEDKCDGCGECVPYCHEGAIQMVQGKAKLVSDVYCDGLGACLKDCPKGAITMTKREAADFDEAAVKKHLADLKKKEETQAKKEPKLPNLACGCPGTAVKTLGKKASAPSTGNGNEAPPPPSALGQWPVQLMLVPPMAPYLKNSDLLLCADCVPFAVPDFHSRYLEGRAVLVGCPKLDDLEHYQEKLENILSIAQPKSLTVLRMEVPCCAGIASALVEARDRVAPNLPVRVDTIGISGEIRQEVLAPL